MDLPPLPSPYSKAIKGFPTLGLLLFYIDMQALTGVEQLVPGARAAMDNQQHCVCAAMLA